MRSLALLALAAACAQPNTPGGDDGLDTLSAQFSPIGQAAIAALRDGHADARGLTWDASLDNSFDTDWVVQTPLATYWGQPANALPIASDCAGDPACDPDFGLLACSTQADCTGGGTCSAVAATVARPGDAPRKLCVGHSDAVVDRIYDLLAGATSTIEISSLAPPDGRFEAAVRNALALLARSGRAVHVRYLYGAIIGASLVEDPRTPDQVLASLVRDVDPASSLHVAVGYIRDGLVSWDHAKMIVVDGSTALVGGHNMWTRHYLQAAPVHDVSMIVHGGAAQHASRFIDALWRDTCIPPSQIGSSAATAGFPDASVACEEMTLAPDPGGTGARVIEIGRLGALGDEASDDAIVAMVDAAQSSLKLSLQDIGPVGDLPWPEPYVRALASAVGRGVAIDVIVTNLNARPDGLTAGSASYSNGWTPADLVQHVADYATAHPDVIGPHVTAAMCKLRVAGLRQGPDDTWPDGSSFANHAKLAIVDDAAFYLGSQNWYPANLVEYGYIVDDVAAATQLEDAYFDKAWAASSRVAVTASGCAP